MRERNGRARPEETITVETVHEHIEEIPPTSVGMHGKNTHVFENAFAKCVFEKHARFTL